MAGSVQVRGFDELAQKLRALPGAMRVRVLRNALAAGARVVRDEVRRNTPVLAVKNASPSRKPGTVKKAISVRTSKQDRRNGNVGVFVNVRPAAGAKYKRGVQVKASRRGSSNPNDPYYWRWLNFGWTPATGKRGAAGKRRRAVRSRTAPRQPGIGFLQAGAKKLPEALRIFQTQVGVWIAKVNASGKVQP